MNVAAHLDIDPPSDIKYNTKADGLSFQVGVGYQINKQFSVELVQEELKAQYKGEGDTIYNPISITATSVAVNYSFLVYTKIYSHL